VQLPSARSRRKGQWEDSYLWADIFVRSELPKLFVAQDSNLATAGSKAGQSKALDNPSLSFQSEQCANA
jgi:hypothetical protein